MGTVMEIFYLKPTFNITVNFYYKKKCTGYYLNIIFVLTVQSATVLKHPQNF